MGKVISVRDALHKAVAVMDMAKDTGNRDRYAQARDFFKTYWSKRNTGCTIEFR